MAYSIVETTSPTYSAVISTADLKAFLRVTHSDEDTLIEAMRAAAIQHIESFCNIRLGDRTAVMYLDDFPQTMEIPVGPVNSITTIEYATGAATKDTLSTANYYVDTNRVPARITFINFPSIYQYSHQGVEITFDLGYAEADVPEGIVHAIKLLVSHMYELRQPEISGTITTKVKIGLEALLNPYRVISFR
jgi:uncharacterized phiE125 gp8 family phage protein